MSARLTPPRPPLPAGQEPATCPHCREAAVVYLGQTPGGRPVKKLRCTVCPQPNFYRAGHEYRPSDTVLSRLAGRSG